MSPLPVKLEGGGWREEFLQKKRLLNALYRQGCRAPTRDETKWWHSANGVGGGQQK